MNEQILSRHGVIVIRFVILPLLRHPEVYVMVNPFLLGRVSEWLALRILLLEYLEYLYLFAWVKGVDVPCGANVPQEA
jgi:hypothetical protein